MIRFLKAVCGLFSFIFILIILFGCKYSNDITNEEYEIHIIDEENKKIAVGDIKYKPANGVAFIPYSINGYTVSCISTPDPIRVTHNLHNLFITRIYLPATIEKIGNYYINAGTSVNRVVFFCNKPIDLYELYRGYDNEYIKIYVPSEYYDGYKEINNQFNIYKANICYFLNLEENDYYYYVDYYEENSFIEFIPPNPVKEGYVFDGWYKEKECINKWDFEIDTVKLEENIEEIKLYAKWIEE